MCPYRRFFQWIKGCFHPGTFPEAGDTRSFMFTTLARMLQLAGYDESSSHRHLAFFRAEVMPYLRRQRIGPCLGRTTRWHSFMTDDHEPIEFSFKWADQNTLPTVRYSIEPVSLKSGTTKDPANLRTAAAFVQRMKTYFPGADWTWYNILSAGMLCEEQYLKPGLVSSSQIFFAFDLLSSSETLKACLIPSMRAQSEGATNLDVVLQSLSQLSLDEAISSALGSFTRYLGSIPVNDRPEVELVGFDCIEPINSRLKIYVRSHRTSFQDVINALTLGGQLRDADFDRGLAALEELWNAVLGLSSPANWDQQLPAVSHRTAGILYYYEFKPFLKSIKTKLYIPVRHYVKNDHAAAFGLSEYLQSRPQSLQGVDYADAVQILCSRRPLWLRSGFQTYITCSVVEGQLQIASYFNPQASS